MGRGSGSDRTPKLGGWRSEKQVAAGKRRERGLREGNGRALKKRPNREAGAMRSSSSWGSGGSGGCGKAELLWMADGSGRALGKRANAKIGRLAQREASSS